QSTETPNQITGTTRNGVHAASSFSHSAMDSMVVRVAACCDLIAPNGRLATRRGRLRSDRSTGAEPRGALPDAAASKFFTSASIAAAMGENRASQRLKWDSGISQRGKEKGTSLPY